MVICIYNTYSLFTCSYFERRNNTHSFFIRNTNSFLHLQYIQFVHMFLFWAKKQYSLFFIRKTNSLFTCSFWGVTIQSYMQNWITDSWQTGYILKRLIRRTIRLFAFSRLFSNNSASKWRKTDISFPETLHIYAYTHPVIDCPELHMDYVPRNTNLEDISFHETSSHDYMHLVVAWQILHIDQYELQLTLGCKELTRWKINTHAVVTLLGKISNLLGNGTCINIAWR